jgi:putative membrane protein
MSEKLNFKIDERKATRYFYRRCIITIVFGLITFGIITIVFGLIAFGIGLVATLVYAFTFGPWLSRRQAEALIYALDGTTIRIDQGVYFLKRKAIPLDRVTDIVVTQGPLMRWCGLWRVDIQTAGSGQEQAEGYLYGLCDPEAVRDQLLSARDRAVEAGNPKHI